MQNVLKLNSVDLGTRARNTAGLAAPRRRSPLRPRGGALAPHIPAGRAGLLGPAGGSRPELALRGTRRASRGPAGAPGPGAARTIPAPSADLRPPPRTTSAPRAAYGPLPSCPASCPAPLVCDWPGCSPAADDWCSPRASFACGGAERAAEPRRGSCAGAAAEHPSRPVAASAPSARPERGMAERSLPPGWR